MENFCGPRSDARRPGSSNRGAGGGHEHEKVQGRMVGNGWEILGDKRVIDFEWVPTLSSMLWGKGCASRGATCELLVSIAPVCS